MLRILFLVLFSALALTSYGFTKTSPTLPCSSTDTLNITKGDTTEYEIFIIEMGYENWMLTNAKPKWFYTNDYLKNKNQFFVIDWNNRVISSMSKPPFEERINYEPNIDYGLDVNYQLYWYFKFIEHKYDVKLRGIGKDW